MGFQMKARQIFNGIFFVNLLAMVVIGVQLFTGFFIEPGIQVAILTIVNMAFRLFTGQVIIADVKASVEHSVEKPKIWYESKMLWLSIISFVGAMIQSITGWTIPQDAYLQIVTAISFVIAIVTHKPVNIV